MKPSNSISVFPLIWAAFLLTYVAYNFDKNIVIVTAFVSPSLEHEAEALSLVHCEYTNATISTPGHYWSGVSCNDAENVTEISLKHVTCGEGRTFEKLMNFSCFPSLVRLNLSAARLEGIVPSEMSSLSKLTHLDLFRNGFTGQLPLSLANLSQLVVLDLSSNKLNGSIPQVLGSLKNLVVLNLSTNCFSGTIPLEFGYLESLTLLDLSVNKLKGPLPPTFGHLTSLSTLDISSNQLNGSIPLGLGKLKNLMVLNLSSNNLIGPIVSSLGVLASLKYLNLSSYCINGSIDPEIENLKELIELDLSHNNISGIIPNKISQLRKLQLLNLSWNKINGSIPVKFCTNIHTLVIFDLSHNLIGAEITCQLGNKTLLTSFNLTHIYLHSSIHSPPPQYDSPVSAKTSEAQNISKILIRIVLPICIFLVLSSLLLLLVLKRRLQNKKRQPDNRMKKNGDIFSIWNYDGKIAFEDIIKATENFDIKYCIGKGSYGRVYRAQLPNGKVIALKKLHHYQTQQTAIKKSFKNEIKTLTEIRHRNIVRLHGFCLHNRCMFLIYSYMERGSLFSILQNDAKAVELDWTKRVNIIKETAHALSYMHHDCNSVWWL